jgi:hypothetical protein
MQPTQTPWRARAGRPASGPRLALLPLIAILAACGPLAELGVPVPGRAVPGFDTSIYPGDATMRTWRAESPYRWVGYYLRSPCRRDHSWTGRRATLEGMGWGLAPLYVGEQDWGAASLPPDTAADPGAALPGGVRCRTANLTAERGRADAAEAGELMAGEGFPAGSVVYLNVERVERITPELLAYVGAWFDALLDAGRYRPGLYAHAHNAGDLHAVLTAAFVRRGVLQRPRLWVARSGGFALDRRPADSGFDAAFIWQGLIDVHETWGGVRLRIDANVAETGNPAR